MAGKKPIEPWYDEFFGKLQESHAALTDRELAIVIGGCLESALGELLCAVLTGPKKKVTDYVQGLSFEHRVKLAFFTGHMNEQIHDMFGPIQTIRNRMAHRVKVDLLTIAKEQNSPLVELHKRLTALMFTPETVEPKWLSLRKALGTNRFLCRQLIESAYLLLEAEVASQYPPHKGKLLAHLLIKSPATKKAPEQ